MDDGLGHDDRYRMVEDEFLTIAKKFTVHLHAAEYKRQERMVKARNADAISSISRPVTGKMTDRTKRKVDSLARSRTQRNALESLPGATKIPGVSDDSSDDQELPYIGTTLHGLMDSPRRKASSMARFELMTPATRAAAGYHKPATDYRLHRKQDLEPPKLKTLPTKRSPKLNRSPTEFFDMDLNAPIPAPKFASLKSTGPQRNSACFTPQTTGLSRVVHTTKLASLRTATSGEDDFVSEDEVVTVKAKPPEAAGPPSRTTRRLAYARLQKAKQGTEDNDKTSKLDLIPTFL